MSEITACRSCEAKNFDIVLDLGALPLANALLTREQCSQPERNYPLTLVRCATCSLLQITERVPADILFSHYFYCSSFSRTFLEHCKSLAQRMIRERQLSASSLVIDIASNDGYLLQYYREKNIPILGVEPARNIAAKAVEEGIPTRMAFFTSDEAEAMAQEGIRADVIHANNVLPHVANQKDFVRGIKQVLKPTGIAVIEFAYAVDTIDRTEFDQIYHEHMCYFSFTSFQRLCSSAGLATVSVERLSVHGGSLRVFLAHSAMTQDASVAAMLHAEKAWGVDTPEPYRKFATRVATLKTSLLALLNELKAHGKRIAVYGASAKGSTLMNSFGIGKELVDYIVDRNRAKHGFFSPGTHVEIFPAEKLLSDQPEYTLLLTWNFEREILLEQKEYRARGGKFIVPIPEPTVV